MYKFLFFCHSILIFQSCQENASSSHKAKSIDSNTENTPTTSCKPLIKSATSSLDQYSVFHVEGFQPTDITCWEALKNHGITFCHSRFPCRIIYLESFHLNSDKSDPSHPDYSELKKYGIGEFTKFKGDIGWQLAGADEMAWERNETGFDYFSDK